MHILCPTDFSKPATEAADVAAAVAKALELPLRLLHCAQDWVVMGELAVAVPDDQAVRERLEREASRLRATGIDVVEEFRRGSASLEILAAASEQPTRMIVIGSLGKNMAERWLIGSVAERVAEGTPVPTLVVREPELLKSWLTGDTALRLLCAVDYTASAIAAIGAMQMCLAVGRTEVEAAYVRPADDTVFSRGERSVRQRDVWERVHAVLGDVPVTVHVREMVGSPAGDFLETAEDRRPGLLIVGAHQRHGWQRLQAPSFSRNVLAHARTNVLCVPAVPGAPEADIPSIRRVLLATDFSSASTEALRHACSLLPAGGSIHLVHICAGPSGSINPMIASEMFFDHSLATAKAREEAVERMKALASAIPVAAGVTITSEVLTHDDIAAAICAAAERCGADVISMATKGHSRAGVALLGSTVQAVLAKAHKPVLVVTPALV